MMLLHQSGERFTVYFISLHFIHVTFTSKLFLKICSLASQELKHVKYAICNRKMTIERDEMFYEKKIPTISFIVMENRHSLTYTRSRILSHSETLIASSKK